MRSLLTHLGLLGLLSTAAAASVPAPMHGIWQLTALTSQGMTVPLADTTMTITGHSVSGHLGCGTFRGTITTQGHAVTTHVTPLPPRPTERCLYAQPGDFHSAMNGVTAYVLSSNTRQLVLLSRTGRLTFTRVGYVSPARN